MAFRQVRTLITKTISFADKLLNEEQFEVDDF